MIREEVQRILSNISSTMDNVEELKSVDGVDISIKQLEDYWEARISFRPTVEPYKMLFSSKQPEKD